MRMMICACAVAILLAASGQCQSKGFQVKTGSDYLETCPHDAETKEPSDVVVIAYCLGFVHGILDGSARMLTIFHDPQVICLPSNRIGGDQMWRVISHYMAERPQDLHYSAPSLIIDAYMDAFPCKDKPTKDTR